MSLSRRTFLIASLAAIPATRFDPKPEQNWPGFRGPGSQGIADGYTTQTTWDLAPAPDKPKNLLWRTEVPGMAHSSPIIWGDRIYLATAVKLSGKAPLRIGYYGDVKASPDNDEQKWMILCFDKKSGKRLWDKTLRTSKPATDRHEKSSHANTTLVTDGKNLVGFFGSEGSTASTWTASCSGTRTSESSTIAGMT
ncbi:MAG: hypothetical protein IPL01_09895 [Acidobacteria bacterium]|nr:hypothetical protein [Acidobacteriota bacterium]